MNKAIVLLSGGLDSATTAAVAREAGYQLLALSFRYGQRHASELAAAERVAKQLGITEHRIVDIDLAAFGGSALTGDIAVPKDRSDEELAAGIPITYVPARNTIFLSYALAAAEVSNAEKIFIGVNAVDYSGYPDCRPEFITAFETMANLALQKTVEKRLRISIETPIITMSKAEIIALGTGLGVDYSQTVSCYDANAEGRACGRCDSCRLRARGFADADIPDPTRYQEGR